jgi:hypothetical protein
MKSVMWKQWVPASAVTGKAIMMIAFNAGQLSAKPLEDHFERLGPIDYQPIKKNKRTIEGFYYRMGYGYRDH